MLSQKADIKDILKDPAAVYSAPQDVIDDDSLSLEDKKEVLKSWEEDIKALMRASGENMPSPEKTQTTGDKLTLISKMRQDLEEQK